MALIDELATARRRIADLEFEVDTLRRTRAEVEANDRAGRFSAATGLTPSQQIVLAALYARPGRFCQRWAIMDLLYADRDEPPLCDRIVDVYLHQIRQTLPPGSIACERSVGWALTPAGRSAVDDALSAFDERVAA